MPGSLLLLLYLAVALAPVAIAWSLGLPPRPLLDELSSGIALVATSMLLMEFVLSGRFRPISRRTGIDATMRFHQLVARPVTVLLLIHPFLYTTPMIQTPLPWDSTGQASLGLDGAGILTGIAAWALLGVLVVSAILRDHAPWRYEAWRLSHGAGAALIAGFGTHHAIEAGRYSHHSILAAFWLALLGLALLTLVIVYLVRPLLQMRHPYRVSAVRQLALKIWEVEIAPMRGRALSFEPGQFVWLTLNRSPFAIREHPFSIASAPAETDRLSFVIKEVGDFTRQIGQVAVGSSAYIDGPHGALTLDAKPADGIVFLAGGVGIAPVLSILRQLRKDRDTRPLKLIYGNRVKEQIVYGEELDEMTRTLNLSITHVLSEPPKGWRGPVGVVDEALVRSQCEQPDMAAWAYVVCGPPAMINAIEDALVAMGIPEGRILSEKFSYE
ncbi:MAG: ferredoxin reductase family protein [Alphaproteobacteria bacterium]|nr:ferredoxin reductase family protein [Alphaproteobacteria bacterium]